MPTRTKQVAIEKLAEAVQRMNIDDLLDFHNEMFPESPLSRLDSTSDGAAVRNTVMDYLRRGLEVEELLDLWNVAFPAARVDGRDDGTDSIFYLEEPASVGQVDWYQPLRVGNRWARVAEDADDGTCSFYRSYGPCENDRRSRGSLAQERRRRGGCPA